MSLLTVDQAAARMNISQSSTRRLLAPRGPLRCVRINGCVRIEEGDLARFVASCRREPKVSYLPTARRIEPGALAEWARRQVRGRA